MNLNRRYRVGAALTLIAATATGCGLINVEALQVRHPLTPEQAKAQVTDAARSAVSALGIDPTEAWVSLSSCNAQGEAPFRGEAFVHFPLADSMQAAEHDIEGYLQRLRAAGWQSDPGFHSNADNVEKDGVAMLLEPQGVGDQVRRLLTFLGQCRDVTTTKQTRGRDEPFTVR